MTVPFFYTKNQKEKDLGFQLDMCKIHGEHYTDLISLVDSAISLTHVHNMWPTTKNLPRMKH